METAQIKEIPVEEDDIIGKATASEIVDPKTKETLIPTNKLITSEDL